MNSNAIRQLTRPIVNLKAISLLLFFISAIVDGGGRFFLPVQTKNRSSADELKLTPIGSFGLVRKARKNIPSHYHSGIDIKRPNPNFINEPIYPIAKGMVISKRDDGPYAQLIIEHEYNGVRFWTLYEHLAGITVDVNNAVSPETPIGRFMNRSELNHYGWQFDHLHFEVLRIRPTMLRPGPATPTRFYSSYSLMCFSKADLEKYFFDPLQFLAGK
jgi:murein DD-endopeptidase MepM/ murein hydrolase activator NlpD